MDENGQTPMSNGKTLFSKRISGGKNRTYFFDVKESTQGSRYLTINESRQMDGTWKSNRLLLWTNHAQQWKQTLDEALSYLEQPETTQDSLITE